MNVSQEILDRGSDGADREGRLAELRAKEGVYELMLLEVRREMGQLGAVTEGEPEAPVVSQRVGRMTVGEFAAAMGVPPHTAYRWLEAGRVPGAFKTSPEVPGSRWYVPQDAPARMRERGEFGG